MFLCHFLSGLALQLHNFSEKFQFMNCDFIFRRFFAVFLFHLIANALWQCRFAYFMRFLWLIWTSSTTSFHKIFDLFIDSSISTASIWFSVAIELMQGTRPVFEPVSGICMIGEFLEMQTDATAGFLDLVQVIKLHRRIHCQTRQFFRPQRPLLMRIFAFWYRLCYK